MNPKKNVTSLVWSAIVLLFLVGWLVLTFFYQPRDVKSSCGPSSQLPAFRIANIPVGPPQFPGLNFGALTHPTTILFMGTDVVYDGAGRHLQADRTAFTGRSDTIMLAFLNPFRNKVSVLHVPRDTEVCIGKYGVQKVNSANAVGGPECTKAALTSLLNVGIDHYVVMNIQGLVELVNELGGVTVEVPKKMSYMDWTAKLKIDLEPGVHTLTGNQAMGFVRFRHDELGDIGRVQRQQLFLQAATRKMMDPRSWVHIPALLGIAQRNIQTDLSEMDIFQCLNFMHSLPRESFKFVMLPGYFAGNGDWIANSMSRAVVAQLADPDQELVESRRNISIAVQNASSDPLLGSKLAQALRKLGYITSVMKDDREAPKGPTRIIVQNGNCNEARMIQQDLGSIGSIVNASVGNLCTSFTIVAHDDINLEAIKMSSTDAPYVQPVAQVPLINVPGAGINQRRSGRNEKQAATREDAAVANTLPGATEAAPAEVEPAADTSSNNNTEARNNDDNDLAPPRAAQAAESAAESSKPREAIEQPVNAPTLRTTNPPLVPESAPDKSDRAEPALVKSTTTAPPETPSNDSEEQQ